MRCPECEQPETRVFEPATPPLTPEWGQWLCDTCGATWDGYTWLSGYAAGVAAERERAARVADGYAKTQAKAAVRLGEIRQEHSAQLSDHRGIAAREIAAAIRAEGGPHPAGNNQQEETPK